MGQKTTYLLPPSWRVFPRCHGRCVWPPGRRRADKGKTRPPLHRADRSNKAKLLRHRVLYKHVPRQSQVKGFRTNEKYAPVNPTSLGTVGAALHCLSCWRGGKITVHVLESFALLGCYNILALWPPHLLQRHTSAHFPSSTVIFISNNPCLSQPAVLPASTI